MTTSRTAFALAGVLALAPVSKGEAAGLGIPEPPVISVPSPIAIPEYSSGWYFRGDIAWGIFEDPEISQSGVGFSGEDIDDTWGFGAGFGYIFNDNFRGDVTVDYRLDADLSARDPATGSTHKTELASTVVLANLYYDIAHHDRFTPYVGGGLGFAYHDTTSRSISLGGVQTGSTRGNDETDFAAAAMAGFSYRMSDAWLFDAGYRFLYLGDAKTGSGTAAGVLQIDDVLAHELRFGVRYEFR